MALLGYRIVGTYIEAVAGDALMTGVHDASECTAPCVVHSPSAHHMRHWQLWWRGDRGMFERICSHGVGHPDPDQVAYWRRSLPTGETMAESVHGCCGCCIEAS